VSAVGVHLDPRGIKGLAEVFFEPVEASPTLPADTIPALEVLRRRGSKLAIVSNTPWGSGSKVWRRAFDRFGLTGYFDVIAFSSEVGWRKPSREILEWVTSRLEVAPEDCVFVGDSPKEDIDGAANMGMRAVLKRTPRFAGEEVPADVVSVERLSELPRVLDQNPTPDT
jgi:putative hydrolase of the HAD superfamily